MIEKIDIETFSHTKKNTFNETKNEKKEREKSKKSCGSAKSAFFYFRYSKKVDQGFSFFHFLL